MRIFLPLAVLAWSAAQLAPGTAQPAGVPGALDAAKVALTISRSPTRLDVEGDASSVAHEAILRESVNRFYGAEALQTVNIDLRKPVHTPPGWALITDMVLRAVSTTRSGNAEITDSTVRIRGISTSLQDWEAALLSVEAALLDGMTLDHEIVTVDKRDSFESLCRRQLLQLVRNNRIEFFRSGALLRSNAFPTLDAIVELAIDCPQLKIRVTGHTDSSGDETSNVALSQARANSVAAYLHERGLPKERLEAVGVGSSEPRSADSTARSRRLNRRVEFRLIEP